MTIDKPTGLIYDYLSAIGFSPVPENLELDDAEVEAELAHTLHPGQHKGEGEEERRARAVARVAWRKYGVPTEKSAPSKVSPVDSSTLQQLQQINESLRHQVAVDGPDLKDKITGLEKALKENLDNGTDKLATEVRDLRVAFTGAIGQFRDDMSAAYEALGRATHEEHERYFHFWRWVVIVFLLLLALGFVSLKVHAQIDVIRLQDNAGNPVATIAAPFTFKAGANCSWTVARPIFTFNCAGAGGGLADPGANGYVVRTALNTTVARTFTTSGPITVTNADGTVGATNFGCSTCVTSVTASQPAASSGGTTPNITLNFGDNLQNDLKNANQLEFTPADPTVLQVVDEFHSGTTSSGNIGQLAWGESTIGAAPGIVTPTQGDWNHPGTIRMTTSATSGQGGCIVLTANGVTSSGYDPYGANTLWDGYWIFALNKTAAVTTTTTMVVGFVDNATTALLAVNGIYVRYDTNKGDTAFSVVTSSAGTATVGATTYAVDNNFHKLRIRSTTTGQIIFTFDANADQTLSTNVPTVNLIPAFCILTDTTAARDLWVDYFALKTRGLTR